MYVYNDNRQPDVFGTFESCIQQLNLAMRYYDEKLYDLAFEEFDIFFKLNPNTSGEFSKHANRCYNKLYGLAEYFQQSNQLEKAISCFTMILERCPMATHVRHARYCAYKDLGKQKEASDDLKLFEHFAVFKGVITDNLIVSSRLIEKGKFGEVAVGFFNRTKVAIKKVPGPWAIEEAKIHRELSHPNIVRMYDFIKNQYLILELMSKDLANVLIAENDTGRQKLTLYVRLSIALDVLSALIYLHQKNILYCDLKPENVLLNHEIAKLCDFGLAVEESKSNRKAGTERFAAPELLDSSTNSVNTKATDYYSFGALLCALMSNQFMSTKEITTVNVVRNLNRWEAPPRNTIDSILTLIFNCAKFDPSERTSATQASKEIEKIKLDYEVTLNAEGSAKLSL